MQAQTLQALPAVLALELAAGEIPGQVSFTRDQAAELAALIASDLHALLPQVAECRLALAGALFDTVELLRPGFPVWATLDELARRVPRGHLENVVAFGSHEGHMPAPSLQPDPAYADGPMRLLPLSLLAPSTLADELAQQMEVELVGRGEAGERTADWLMRTLGVQLEHVRYLSRNDVLALTCVQYEHVNLAPFWTLLEAALLTPYRAENTLSARGLPIRYADGKLHVPPPSQWLQTQTDTPTPRAHALAGVIFELRQYAALAQAHGLQLVLDQASEHAASPSLTPLPSTPSPQPTDEAAAPAHADALAMAPAALIETLAEPLIDLPPPQLFAHEAAGLGIIAVTVAQRAGALPRVLAHGYPLSPQALGPLITQWSMHYGCAAELHALGQVLVDAQGRLSAPADVLH